MTTTELTQYQPAPGFIAPVVAVKDALIAYQAKKDLIDGIMKSGVDFGVIPGSAKPSLLKAGAEKATSFFGLSPRFKDAGIVEDWTGENHGGEPFFYYRRTCELWRGGQMVASVDGSCNSWEKKYRYRGGERVCPECGKPAIKKSKYAPRNKNLGTDPGWYCFDKAGGCGMEFSAKDPAIINQQLGQVKNPDVADLVNTILKMADKRALVAATLIATGLSEYFTQDVEDYVTGEYTEVAAPAPAQSHSAPQPAKAVKAEKIISELGFEPPHPVDVEFPPAKAPAPVEQSDDTPTGNINPKMLVDYGMSKDIPSAAAAINKLQIGGKPAAEFWNRVILYRAWRDAGHDPDTSAVQAIAGEPVPAE